MRRLRYRAQNMVDAAGAQIWVATRVTEVARSLAGEKCPTRNEVVGPRAAHGDLFRAKAIGRVFGPQGKTLMISLVSWSTV